uniref:Uncharacterized protein n=1 Tax=Panagrolaimus davidi TaxID=227884 RepID=A0A914QP63_9BILA
MNEKEVERLRKERYNFKRKNKGQQKDSSGAKIGVGLLLGAVLGGAAVYGLSKALNNDDEKQKQRNPNSHLFKK